MNSPDNPSDRKKKDAFSNFADGLLAVEEEDRQAKKQILKEGIEKIEKEDKSSLKRSRVITKRLSEIREKADLSPFVGTSGKIKSPRFRRGEFIQLLARELLYIGREEMADKGGIISLKQLKEHFHRTRENWELRENDIQEAIKWLDDEELIPEISSIKDDVLIHFRPIELSTDTRKVLEMATGIQATKQSLLSLLGWPEERLDNALNQLVADGIAILDGDNIYFPGI